MKAKEAVCPPQSGSKDQKNQYYAKQLAAHLFGMQDYELREMLANIKTTDLEWDLEKFLHHMDSAPSCARLRLLLEKLQENSCCTSKFITSFLAGVVCYRIEAVLGKNPNVSLH